MHKTKLQEIKQTIRTSSMVLFVVGLLLVTYAITMNHSQIFASDFEPDCKNQEAIVPAGFGKVSEGIARAYYRVKNCGYQTHTISATVSSGICLDQTGSCYPTKKTVESASLTPGSYITFTAPMINTQCGSVQTDIQPQGLPSHGEYTKLALCSTPSPTPLPTKSPTPQTASPSPSPTMTPRPPIVMVMYTPQPTPQILGKAIVAKKTLPSTGDWGTAMMGMMSIIVAGLGYRLSKYAQ